MRLAGESIDVSDDSLGKALLSKELARCMCHAGNLGNIQCEGLFCLEWMEGGVWEPSMYERQQREFYIGCCQLLEAFRSF